MDQSIAEQLHTVLGDLATNVPDIKASAVVRTDGLTIASQLPVGIQEDRVGAVSAALLSLGERSALEMSCAAQGNGVRVRIEYSLPVTMPFLGTVIGSQDMTMSARVENSILSPACP